MARGADISPEIRERIRQLAASGKGTREIARVLQLPRSTVKDYRRRLGLSAPPWTRPPVSKEQRKKIRELVGRDWTTPQIARELGLAEPTVRKHVRLMRLTAKRPKNTGRKFAPGLVVVDDGGRDLQRLVPPPSEGGTCERCHHRYLIAQDAAGAEVRVEPGRHRGLGDDGRWVYSRRAHDDVCLAHQIRDGRLAAGQPLPRPGGAT